MRAAVLGLGKSGISAARYLQQAGYSVVATDDKATSAPEGIEFSKDIDLNGCNFVVISPGIPLTHPVAKMAKDLGIEIFCDVELAFRNMQDAKIVGITGSNGKTTTTSLACHMLNASGINAKTVGNIGTPILSETLSGSLVVELSSFQLETMSSPALDAAVILNITPNHLDRHGTMEEYTKAKLRIGSILKPEATLWVKKGLFTGYHQFGFDADCELYTDGAYIYRFGKKEAPMPPLTAHNAENFLAAYALACSQGADPELCAASYASFTKPKHRLEYIGSHNDVQFYDDSKATSIDAVLRAVESIDRPIVLIAGGVHKGYPYDAWREPFTKKVRSLVLIGQAADIIEDDLQNAVPVVRASTFEEAVERARTLAREGDAVLLSPGCASYDMFTSFEERGKKFQQLIGLTDHTA